MKWSLFYFYSISTIYLFIMRKPLLPLLTFLCLLFVQCSSSPETPKGGNGSNEETDTLTLDTSSVLINDKKVEEPAKVDHDTTQWQELARLDPTILLDLRYATDNNFVKEKMYDCGRCFLRPDVAVAVVDAHRFLQKKGLGLKMYDCYRPRPTQWKLWNKVPDPRYVADPRKGSMHNRGMAIDLTIVDSLGNELDMGTDFDFFGKEAYHSFAGHGNEVSDNRALLVELMDDHGFRSTTTEWWHYSYRSKAWEIDDWLWLCE